MNQTGAMDLNRSVLPQEQQQIGMQSQRYFPRAQPFLNQDAALGQQQLQDVGYIRGIADDLHASLPLNDAVWKRGWTVWSEQRPRARMAQFIINILHEGQYGGWMDISCGKFEITNWPEVARLWYNEKERGSEVCEATSMLRKGLPRAFPDLEEVKEEAQKEGTQYIRRVFVVPGKIVKEVMNSALQPEYNDFSNNYSYRPTGAIYNMMRQVQGASQPTQSDMAERFLLQQQQQEQHRQQQLQQQQQQEQQQLYQQQLLKQQQQSQYQQQQLLHGQFLQRQQQAQLAQRPVVVQQPNQQQHDPLSQHHSWKPDVLSDPDTTELLMQNGLINEEDIHMLGASGGLFDVRSDSPASSSAGGSSTQFGHTSTSAASIESSSPSNSLGRNVMPQVLRQQQQQQQIQPDQLSAASPYNESNASSGSPEGLLQTPTHQRYLQQQTQQQQAIDTPASLALEFERTLEINPTRSHVSGGGRILLMQVSPVPLPEGRLVAVFSSTSGQDLRDVQRVNDFICTTTIPPHLPAEMVSLHIIINQQRLAMFHFDYYDDSLVPDEGALATLTDEGSLSQIHQTLGHFLGLQSAGGSAGSDTGSGGYPGNSGQQQGAYQCLQNLLCLGIKFSNPSLIKTVLESSPEAKKCVSVPGPSGEYLDQIAARSGCVSIAACLKSIRLRNQTVKSGDDPSFVDPLSLLPVTAPSAEQIVAELIVAANQPAAPPRLGHTRLSDDTDDEQEDDTSDASPVVDETPPRDAAAAKPDPTRSAQPALLLTTPSLSREDTLEIAAATEPDGDTAQVSDKSAGEASERPPPQVHDDDTGALRAMVGALQLRLRQMELKHVEQSQVLGLVQQNAEQVLRERQQLAAMVIQLAGGQGTTTASTAPAASDSRSNVSAASDDDDEERHRPSTLTRSGLTRHGNYRTTFHVTPPHVYCSASSRERDSGSDNSDDETFNPVVAKDRIRELLSTIVKLRSEQVDLQSQVKQAMSSTISRTRTVSTRRRLYHLAHGARGDSGGDAGRQGTSSARSYGSHFQSSGYQSVSMETVEEPEEIEAEATTYDAKTLEEEHDLHLPPGEKDYGIEVEQAYFVNSVTEGGVAAKTFSDRLQAGDIIVKINDKEMTKVFDGEDVRALLQPDKEGVGPKLTCITPRVLRRSPETAETRPISLDVPSPSGGGHSVHRWSPHRRGRFSPRTSPTAEHPAPRAGVSAPDAAAK